MLAAVQEAPPLVWIQAQLLPEQVCLARAVSLSLQPVQLLVLFLQPSWQTHRGGLIPQIVKDGAPHMGPGEGIKGRLALAAVELSGPKQSEQAHLDEIVQWFGATPVVVQGDGTHHLAGSCSMRALRCCRARGQPAAACAWGNGV
jgi:hypothetical protein